MIRVQLRHTGDPRFLFGFHKLRYAWGYNFTLGRWFLAIRKPSKYASKKLVNLEFGKYMLAEHRKAQRVGRLVEEIQENRYSSILTEDEQGLTVKWYKDHPND